MGVTGIGYTPEEKFGPLAAKCDVLLPQAYATQTSGLSPEECVPLVMRRWKRLFGEKRYDIGLAGYRQPAPGHTVSTSIRIPFAAAQAEPLARDIVYWSLSAIRKSAAVTAAIRALTGASV